jgi:hypothetical protein
VKDNWEEAVFEDVTVETRIEKTNMKLHEEKITVDDYSMREVRRLCPNSHQTGIITNIRILTVALLREKLSRLKAKLYDHQQLPHQEEKTGEETDEIN